MNFCDKHTLDLKMINVLQTSKYIIFRRAFQTFFNVFLYEIFILIANIPYFYMGNFLYFIIHDIKFLNNKQSLLFFIE
jgi:hypothetical protein